VPPAASLEPPPSPRPAGIFFSRIFPRLANPAFAAQGIHRAIDQILFDFFLGKVSLP